MLEKIPFGRTSEQVKKAEDVLMGSALELAEQEEQEPGQVYSMKSKEIKDIDEEHSELTEKAKEVLEEKLSGSELEGATLENKNN